jgi:Domain of unknown function (DUF1707)
LRLSDAEREHLYEQLKRHAAEGRLDVAELERRVAVVAAATTDAEASAALADLPPLGAPRVGSGPPQRARGRGHGHADAPSPGWQPTPERFRDPRTNQVMRVWVDASGGRHYVPE